MVIGSDDLAPATMLGTNPDEIARIPYSPVSFFRDLRHVAAGRRVDSDADGHWTG